MLVLVQKCLQIRLSILLECGNVSVHVNISVHVNVHKICTGVR